MAKLLNPVRAGDLITSAMWNDAVEAINELLQANQNNGIAIAAMSPKGTTDDPIRIDTPMQITGQNFGYSVGQASVTFLWGSKKSVVSQGEMLSGSFDSRLVFMTPEIAGLDEDGETMTLIVDNGVAQDTRAVFVKRTVTSLTGSVFVKWRAALPAGTENPDPNPLLSDHDATFRYELETAGLSLSATFDLSANIVAETASVPSDLVSSIEFRDGASHALLPNKRISMGKNEIRNFEVYIPKIPASWYDEPFSLEITAASGAVTHTYRRSCAVGIPDTYSNDADMEQLTPTVYRATSPHDSTTDPSNGELDGATIKLKAGWLIQIPYFITFKQAGPYTLEIQPKGTTTLDGWTPSLVGIDEHPRPAAGEKTSFTVKVKAPPLPLTQPYSESGAIVLSVRWDEAEVGWKQEFGIQLLK